MTEALFKAVGRPLVRGIASPAVITGERAYPYWQAAYAEHKIALLPCEITPDGRKKALVGRPEKFGLPADEVQRTVQSAWKAHATGNNWFGGGGHVSLPGPVLDLINSDEQFLLLRLRRAHAGRRHEFAISPRGMSENWGWGHNRVRKARDGLLDKRLIEQVYAGGRGGGDPSIYRFSRMISPNLPFMEDDPD